jgi:phosphate transport system substrate-binding protein
MAAVADAAKASVRKEPAMIRTRSSKLILSAIAAMGTLLANGCNSSSNAEPTSSLTNAIGGVGSTFVDPLMKRWIIGFQNAHPKIGVNYRAEGSGAGINEIKKSMTEFAASDAPLGDADLKTMPAVLQIPVTAGPVCVIYNLPQLKSDLRLSSKTLGDIFLGKIVTWNDPAIARDNPGVSLPHIAILVVHRADGSGTTSILTTYLARVSPEWGKKPGAGLVVEWPVGLAGKGSTGVIDLVKRATGAIGYAELNYAKQEDLSVASIQNRAGAYVEPSVAGATAALDSFSEIIAKDARAPIVDPPPSAKDAYPISGVTFVLIPKDGSSEQDRQTVKDFVRYAITDGQSATEGLYYAKLPKILQEQDQKLLAEMTVNGQPLK